jgi:putative membrane-bound dehydrogenase-like protein
MKRLIVSLLLFVVLAPWSQAAEPLRVFIRSGPKTHGPGQHDHPRFLEEYTKLLNERGAKTTGKQGFPTAQELENTDVLVMFLAEGGTISPEDRANLDKFLKRGGGIVTLHDAICGQDPHWFKTIVGGAWEHGHSKWYEGEVGTYFVDTEHPITRGVSNFDFKDEIYYDLHMMPEAKVLATSFHSVFVIAPQMWTYEKENYRSFVWLAGHEYESFDKPHVRALILRGIAWAGKRQNVDELCSKEELGSLKYPEGGPTAPEKAVAKLGVHPEFDINLVASEPLLEKAISMDWDPQGRLWVAETPEYPGGRTINKNDQMVALWSEKNPETVNAGDKEDRPARDRISWLEDSNGDGVMDKRHVFAEGLELVTSMVFYKDGVIVAQAPDILWLRDTNGDGKCNMQDERVVLYTGFGTFDTHAVINNFRWGMDGWIYSAIGYSAGSPTSADGSKEFGRVTAGVIRFKPDGSALEQFTSGSCNTWGFDFAADGEAFYTTATCGEHFLHIVMPEKIIAKGNLQGVRSSAVIPDHQDINPAVKHTRPAYVQIDWVGKFTASAGSCIYTGGAWPEKYNNAHFQSETTMSLVHVDMIKPNGVTYLATKEDGRENTEFVAGTDLWFRPIHTRVGPDGALYVIDFYNQAAIHNDTRGPKHGARNAAVRPDRDHHFGRIYRIQHKQAKQLPKAAFASTDDQIKTLEHPNGWARMTAHRLLMEKADKAAVAKLEKLATDESKPGTARAHALWTSYLISQKHNADVLAAAYTGKDIVPQKAVMQLLRNYPVAAADARKFDKLTTAMAQKLGTADPRLRLETLMAISSAEDTRELNAALWKLYGNFEDGWTESALVSIFARDPEAAILAAADLPNPEAARRTVAELANRLAGRDDANAVARVLVQLAAKPAKADPVKQAVLEAANRSLKQDAVATWNADLAKAFRALLKANDSVATASLPLIARWDKNGELTPQLVPVTKPLLARLSSGQGSNEERSQIVSGLLGLRKLNPEILPAIVGILTGEAPIALKRSVADAMGNIPDEAIGAELVKVYPQVEFEARDPIFAQIVKRPEWAQMLITAMQKNEVELPQLGPSLLHRLRTHADANVAKRAGDVIDEIRGPQLQQKDAIIKQFAAAVEQPGNLEKGRELFTQNCANCHKFKGEGRDVAPDLTGMGAHGAHDLLVHIVDPNRVVEPNFISFSIETKDELSFDGIIARENRNQIVLRNATQDYEINQRDVASRRSSGLSLMPDGFEALGQEGMRDLIAYLMEDESKFRIVDLSSAFTVDSTKGIYQNISNTNDSLQFRRFGLATVEGIPFDIIHPSRTPTGNNLVVLKGGYGFAKTLPRKVEATVNAKANRLHFLGGVGGWAFPCCGDNQNEGMPVMKVTVQFKDGSTKELILKNGEEFADWNGSHDVPGSQPAEGLIRRGQVRWFTKDLGREGHIEKITLESFDNSVAPTIVAITAELGEKMVAQAAPGEQPRRASNPGAIRTLIVGGGSHHEFDKFFHKVDKVTLEKDGLASVEYTEDTDSILPKLANIDVLLLCNNKPFNDEKVRKAIFDFVDAGKGLVLVHPALWYNWQNNWPEYNAKLVGGGSRGHDRYGEFEVRVINKDHPITKNVPESFRIKDELYYHRHDANGSQIEVLAEATQPAGDKRTFPQVWVTKYPKGRVAAITLGHDAAAHDHPAYQTLLRNAVKWAAEK